MLSGPPETPTATCGAGSNGAEALDQRREFGIAEGTVVILRTGGTLGVAVASGTIPPRILRQPQPRRCFSRAVACLIDAEACG